MAGLTITEKILRAHSGAKDARAGDFIYASVDLALGNDITAPLAIKEFEGAGFKKVFDKNKIALVPDHFAPNKDIQAAQQCKALRDFARKHKIRFYFEVGQMGIEHALLPEKGLTLPGQVIIGADSHTCTYGAVGAFSTGVGSTDLAAVMAQGKCWLKVPETIRFIYKGKLNKWVGGKDLILHTIKDIGVDGATYKAMEFKGKVIETLPMDDRFTMCNMAIEAGGKSGIIEPDEVTWRYIREVASFVRGRRSMVEGRSQTFHLPPSTFHLLRSDKDALYCDTREYDVTRLEPQVALPHLPSNVKNVSELKHISIDQVVIGSCTNGRLSDLRIAAKILKGRHANSRVRLLIFPATQKIYLDALHEGLLEIFINAGAVVSTPTCGPCLGGHMGILAEDENAVATTNRNFIGRMGHTKSGVFLSNPAVAAASAILGRIAHPEEVGCR